MADIVPIAPSIQLQGQQSRLLDRVRICLRTKHYSLRTEEAYVGWLRRFILFHGKRHPSEMGEPEINSFLSHLAVRDRVAASTQNQALCALLFLYRHVLQKPFPDLERLIRAKKPIRLPTVMTRDEVRRVLNRMNGTNRVIATLLYGSGMRLLECLRLRVKDVEFSFNRLVVRDAKGQKDRYVPLPVSVRPALVSWFAQVKRWHEADLAAGFGSAYLPYALDKKYRARTTNGAGSGPSPLRIDQLIRDPASSDAITFTRESFRERSTRRCVTRPSRSRSAVTLFVIPSPRICSRTA